VTEPAAREVELTVALPAYEEAANLAVLLPQLKEALAGLGVSHEILVVDTEQPRDATPQVCAEHGVRYLARRGGSLYSDAVRTGIRASTGRWVVFMDADGSHSPSFVPRLWAERDAADVIIASRYIAGGKTENPALLIFLSLAVNVVFRAVLSLDCSDVSNSFRLYRGDALRALTLVCQNFDIVEEILVKLCFTGAGSTVKEIPFTFEQRKAGKTKRDLVSFAVTYVTTLGRLYALKRQARRGASAR
jgi:dolichol-phosphate mannosyltransferase